MKTRFCFLVPAALSLFATQAFSAPVIVHEWGTFTSLQDEEGNAIGGINVDDEPVPPFVSSVAVGVVSQYDGGNYRPSGLGLPPYQLSKSWVSGDPHVTMRLETPVIYFYPPKDVPPKSIPPLKVQVDFHGGVLSQFYPHADFSGLPLLDIPGNPQMSGKFPVIDENTGITGKTTTSLKWNDVQLGSNEKPIETEDKVWTVPREVGASVLQVKFEDADFNDPKKTKTITQAEHFLFYRGVGHVDSPVSARLDSRGDNQYVHMESQGAQPVDPNFNEAWLVQISSDGSCAFSQGKISDQGVVLHETLQFGAIDGSFKKTDFSARKLDQLKASMQTALVRKGLYPDEASAMLRTWTLSYFKSPGLRLFYMPSDKWVNDVLPLKITGTPTEVTRVMIGRIELITDAQKAALARLAAGPCPDLAVVKKAALEALEKGELSEEEKKAFYTGEKPLTELGIPIPPLVQDYLSLGRFRDALIVHEQKLHPSPALVQFISANQLVPPSGP